MTKNKTKNKEWKTPRKVFLVFFFLLLVLSGRYCYLALSPTINGRNMKVFAANRNTVSKVLTAKRGTIYDMSGNVLEWCQDWYDNNYYNNSPEVNPKGPSKGSVQVRRGGCWNYYARLCRVSNRRHITPGDGGNYLGFRLAHSDDK